MRAGGWFRVDDLPDALKMFVKAIVLCAWHYPAPCIELSVWRSSAEPSIFQVHAIRASFGHIYEWIRIDRLGSSMSLEDVSCLASAHVYVRRMFHETIVLRGIATRHHLGRQPMPIGCCTHVIISTGEIGHVDRIKLEADPSDYVVYLSAIKLVSENITLFKVSANTCHNWSPSSFVHRQNLRSDW